MTKPFCFYEDGLFPSNRGNASLLKSDVFVGIELKEVEVYVDWICP
ncbi:hypothetical protein THF1C08_440028 [Vibrio jasicida]|uniref:Uncharacterized protein n=1 Tax=Vibrio jasicida TaxID=766224 RepID=A0AAU9QT27_9VIBR|nr:hypothetical protein THF1C08_440028 [Vibrio jasicida]CAH1600890.1 hypothetical protein THF1A12_440027 [Vibrio jasicida]